jgi:peptide chain release factor 1
MMDRLESIERDFEDLEASLSDPAVLNDQTRLREASRRYKQLTPIVECIRTIKATQGNAEAARELLEQATGEEKELLREELSSADDELASLEAQLRLLLLPRDPNEGKNVIMEIRGAEGGEEANLFAADLMEMYRAYATNQGWKCEIMSLDESPLGGINQVTIMFSGDAAWSHLKFEGGPHRVQRVPVTESQGRIHTSSATVTVMPEAEEVDVEIDEKDLEIDVYRSSGAGGQHVNTTDSAVRITHKPTGVVVAMQDERSQLQNRARAMTVLRARIMKLRQDEHDAAASAQRKAQVGSGGRSEKIRTYNFKENRLTDHRIGLTIYRLQDVLAGNLAEVSDALIQDERTRQLANGEE